MRATAKALWINDYEDGTREIALRILHPDMDSGILIDPFVPADLEDDEAADAEWERLYGETEPHFMVVSDNRRFDRPDFVISTKDGKAIVPGDLLTVGIGIDT